MPEYHSGSFWSTIISDKDALRMLKLGAARVEEKSKATERVHGCSKGGATQHNARDRKRCRQMIHCESPCREWPKEEENTTHRFA